MRRVVGHFGRLALLAAPLAMASFALGQISDLPIEEPIVAEAHAYVFEDGVTAEEYHRQQAALSARLANEAPARALDNPITVQITVDEAA